MFKEASKEEIEDTLYKRFKLSVMYWIKSVYMSRYLINTKSRSYTYLDRKPLKGCNEKP